MALKGMANLNVNKMCAFCKHWYDPTNECIAPKAPAIKMWLYDNTAIRQCIKRGVRTKANASCPKYESKL